MKLETQIANLEKLKLDLPKTIDEIILKNKSLIVGMLKLRLYNEGTDGDGNLIGYYAPSTILEKKANNQKTSFITLRDQGYFYQGMFLEIIKDEYIIDSIDAKTDLLVEVYGEAILELTQEQQENIIINIIDPALQVIIDNHIGNIEIDL